MTISNDEVSPEKRTLDLLHTGAEAELRLLKKERKAERRLAEAIAALAADERRLLRAQNRVAVSRSAVSDAETRLREAQAQRASGPAVAHD